MDTKLTIMENAVGKCGDMRDSRTAVVTFGEALGEAEAWSEMKFDMRLPAASVAFDEFGRFLVPLEGHGLFGSMKSFDCAIVEPRSVAHILQLQKTPGIQPRYLLDVAPSELAAANLNWILSQSRQDWLFRFVGQFNDEGGVILRAIGGSRYNPNLDNRAILRALTEPRYGGRPIINHDTPVMFGRYGSRGYITRDDLFMQIRLTSDIDLRDQRNGGTSPYSAGVAITNSEVKRHALELKLVLQRGPCTNSIYFPIPAYRKYHVGSLTAALAVAEMADAIASATQGGGQWNVQKLFKAADAASRADMTVQQTVLAVNTLIAELNIPRSYEGLFLNATDKYASTRLGVSQAMTDAAQELDNPLLAYEVESIAGAFMLHGMAGIKRQSDEEVEVETGAQVVFAYA
jgi:hypothetical protein